MKVYRYSQILKYAKTALQEYKNWGEDEVCKFAPSAYSLKTKPRPAEPAVEKKLAKKEQTPSQKLENLKSEALQCKKCPLGESRLNCVFGEGSASADIMFVGEGPGFDEDHKGRPFIGKAGQFLTKLIELIGHSRESVYIANIVKCHPMKDPSDAEKRSNDRPPSDEEVSKCSYYLEKQIEIINPKVIVSLGKPAAKYFLKTDSPMGAVRGKFSDYKNAKLMPTYHPSYLIRNGCIFGKKDQTPEITKLKGEVWSDLKKVMNYLKTGQTPK